MGFRTTDKQSTFTGTVAPLLNYVPMLTGTLPEFHGTVPQFVNPVPTSTGTLPGLV